MKKQKQKSPAAPILEAAAAAPQLVGERLQVSVHTLMMASDCRTRLLLKLAGLSDIGNPPPGAIVSMLAGSWGHKAMAAWLSSDDWQPALEPYDAISQQLLIVEDRRGYPNLQRVVAEVVNRYPLERLPFELLDPKTTEVGFVAPLGVLRDGTPVDLIGYIDKLVADKHSGSKIPLEHKFTGKVDAEFIGRFTEYDPQVTAYMYAASTILGIECLEAWVNAIQMSMVPSSERKCPKHGTLYSECGPLHVVQTFIAARRTPAQLEEFKTRALDICERWVLPVARSLQHHGAEIATRTPRDGMFTGACEYCDYRRWCLTSQRSPNLMATMLGKRAEADDTKFMQRLRAARELRSGLVQS